MGAAATASLGAEVAVLEAGRARGAGVGDLLVHTEGRRKMAKRFVDAYRAYCWPVDSVEDLRLAPFQILAGEGKVHALTDHLWHIDVLTRLADSDHRRFAPGDASRNLGDADSEAGAVAWWEEMTGRGGEGMVVKPVDVVHRVHECAFGILALESEPVDPRL